MKLNRNILAAILAGVLAFGAVACETNGEDPLTDDTGAPVDTISPTPLDTGTE